MSLRNMQDERAKQALAPTGDPQSAEQLSVLVTIADLRALSLDEFMALISLKQRATELLRYAEDGVEDSAGS